MRNAIVLIIALLFTQLLIAADDTGKAQYWITWNAEDFPHAQVEARLYCEDGIVRITEWWAGFFEGDRGWAQFIRDVSAEDSSGSALKVLKEGPMSWRIAMSAPAWITVRYTVDYSFAEREWPTGNEQVAYFDGRALYSICFPLFLFTGEGGPADIHVEVPDSLQYSAAWPATEYEDTYYAADHNVLLRNCIVVGQFSQTSFSKDGFSLTLSALDPLGQSSDQLVPAFEKIVAAYVDLFEDSSGGSYLMVLLPGPEDGESFSNSFASSTMIQPTEDNAILWGNNIAHEFLHYWNGVRITTSRDDWSQRQWFSEGFTEYIANLTLLRQGIISRELYLRKLEKHLSLYLLFRSNPFFKDVNLIDAGARKWHYRPGVYSGGVAAAAILDIVIRKESNNSRSVEDLLRLLYKRFGLTGQTYTLDDLQTAIGEVVGRDMQEWFDMYISGIHPLPLAELFREAGVTLLADGYDVFLIPEDESPSNQQHIWTSILNGTVNP